jgi:RNA polymerase primary sigma factor
MVRKIQRPYQSQQLAQLTRQLLFSHVDKRQAQVRRAEKLHDSVDLQAIYPTDFIAFRLTGFRPDPAQQRNMTGQALQEDLRLLIDTLTRSMDMPDDDPGYSPDDLASKLGVTTKTISRWRDNGLRWRWVYSQAKLKRKLVYPQSAIDYFLSLNQDVVQKASSFTRLTDSEYDSIVTRARTLMSTGRFTFNQIARHLARRTGRSLEGVRQALLRHDRDTPSDPIFADHQGPLSLREKQVIFRAWRWGIRPGKIARRYQRTSGTIARIVHEMQAVALKSLILEYIDSPLFHRPEANQVYRLPIEQVPPPADTDPSQESRHDPLAPWQNLFGPPSPALRALFAFPHMPEPAIDRLLMRYHYHKRQADLLRKTLDPASVKVRIINRIIDDLAHALQLRKALMAHALPGAMDIACRHAGLVDQATIPRVLELFTLGVAEIGPMLDSLDPSRHQSFDAGVRWHLMRKFASLSPDTTRARKRSEPDALIARAQSLVQHDPFLREVIQRT